MCCCWEVSYASKLSTPYQGQKCPPPPFPKMAKVKAEQQTETFVPKKLEWRHQGARSSVYSSVRLKMFSLSVTCLG